MHLKEADSKPLDARLVVGSRDKFEREFSREVVREMDTLFLIFDYVETNLHAWLCARARERSSGTCVDASSR